MKLGFDLDKVLIHYPPIIPEWVIDTFYKDRAGEDPIYRRPGKFEQELRKLLHMPFMRLPIKGNLNALRAFSKNKKNDLYLISGRLSFLDKITQRLVKRYKLDTIFTEMFFNFHDEQAHIFKDTIIKKEKIQRYIDDDYSLLLYLAKHNPDVEFFWYNRTVNNKVKPNITATTDFKKIFEDL